LLFILSPKVGNTQFSKIKMGSQQRIQGAPAMWLPSNNFCLNKLKRHSCPFLNSAFLLYLQDLNL
jgi:hypothetical protein